jgi:hypothetical protein
VLGVHDVFARRCPKHLAPAAAASLAAVERMALPAADIRIASERQDSETLLAYASAFQLTLSTVIPDRGVQLHSSYLGHPDAERTSAAHLLLAPARRPRQWSIEHDPATMPVAHARRRCLLDHLAVLADQLRDLTALDVLLDVPADALDQIDRA